MDILEDLNSSLSDALWDVLSYSENDKLAILSDPDTVSSMLPTNLSTIVLPTSVHLT